MGIDKHVSDTALHKRIPNVGSHRLQGSVFVAVFVASFFLPSGTLHCGLVCFICETKRFLAQSNMETACYFACSMCN